MYTHNYMFGDVLFLINLSIKLKMHLDGTHCSPVHNVLGCKHTAQWWCHTLILALSPWGHRCMGRNPRTPPLMGHKIPQKRTMYYLLKTTVTKNYRLTCVITETY